MLTSSTALCNGALIKVGARIITDLDEDSKEANTCREVYDMNRRALLLAHPWNFAVKRTSLAATGDTPAYEYLYEFNAPGDYLRMLDTEYKEDEWVYESGKILANREDFKCRYIRDVTLTGQFSASFDEVLQLKIASDICWALTQSASLTDFWRKEYEKALRLARSYDAQESSTPRVYADSWLNSRY